MTSLSQPLLIPLPNPPRLDLSRPEALQYWQAPVPEFQQNASEMTEFWNRMPPLTAPQFAALRLQRPVAWVSLETIRSTYDRLTRARSRNGHAYEWSRLSGYPRIWDRSHQDATFRFNPRMVLRRAAPAAILRPLMDWVTPDLVLESRFLLAGFDHFVSYSERREVVRKVLRVGTLRGYIKISKTERVPVHAFRPTTEWCRRAGIPERRWKESALDHGQLAVEAALSALGSHGEFPDSFAFETEADALAASRDAKRIRRGDALGSVADLVTIDEAGRRRATEIISENYKDTNITAKYDGLANRVDFVATSVPVARRVAAATGAPCLHF